MDAKRKDNMSQQQIDYLDFLKKDQEVLQNQEEKIVQEDIPLENPVEEQSEELEVQKAVVEELAADKMVLSEELTSLKNSLENAIKEIDIKNSEIFSLKASLEKLKGTVAALEGQLAEHKYKNIFDTQERNPNALALLDRDVELPDRFPGETRDHVIEVIKQAREIAESEGRLRKAQILESVLLANEPNGTLVEKREFLKQLFVDNGNVITGIVLEELKRLGISHKDGEEYLLPDEILKRTY
jgi:chromosome segregation ATPase